MEFDTTTYKVWKLPHPLLIHWVLNPGLAFNELILGQRIPKIMLIDKTSSAPLMERQSIPCPHCHNLNDARRWGKGNTFGHWFGLICPECHGKIPCLWNLTSLVILALTCPLWIWLKLFGEAKWRNWEIARFSRTETTPFIEAKKVSWLKMGLTYGGLMFCLMVLPKIFQHQLTAGMIAVQAGIWLIAGILFGALMKFFVGRQKK